MNSRDKQLMLSLLGPARHSFKAKKTKGLLKINSMKQRAARLHLLPPRFTSASPYLPSSSSVSLVPIEPVNTLFFFSPLLNVLPLSITWPLRGVAMATPPTGAGYLPCYRSNWFPTEFWACHSVSLSPSLITGLPLSLSFFLTWKNPHMFGSTLYPGHLADRWLNRLVSFSYHCLLVVYMPLKLLIQYWTLLSWAYCIYLVHILKTRNYYLLIKNISPKIL